MFLKTGIFEPRRSYKHGFFIGSNDEEKTSRNLIVERNYEGEREREEKRQGE